MANCFPNVLGGLTKRQVIGAEIRSAVSAQWTISTMHLASRLVLVQEAIKHVKASACLLPYTASYERIELDRLEGTGDEFVEDRTNVDRDRCACLSLGV